MLTHSGFGAVRVRNDLFVVRGLDSSSMSSRLAAAEWNYLHFSHALSTVAAWLSFQRIEAGPWLQITSRKP